MPLPTTPELQNLLDQDLNLKDLFAILAPENNLVLADEMMLSDAEGTILYVSENYERRFGFSKGSIVGRSAFELEAEGVFDPCVTATVIREKRKVTTTQQINHTHMNVLTVGVPLFNSRNELKYEVCFNTVSMEQINAIQQQYRTLQESLQQYSAELQDLRARNTDTNGLFFQGPRMQRVWSLIQNIAGTKANILITGETGVGKSVIAKTIHRLSNRSQGPFIEVNCAVLHENLIESELFGYEKGAFTGASSGGKIGKIELANHGTLFLDEIGELPLHVQSNRRIALDFHLIAATNRNLEEDIQSGRFRSDLFYRLNVVRIHIPPLRERREEICPLAYRFLDRFSREYDKKKLTMSPRFLSFLEGYDWPGNVRQLENLMERMAIIAQHPVLDLDDLPAEFDTTPPPAAPAPAGRSDTRSLSERMEDYEGEMARELGISQATAARKIAKYVAGYPERG